MRHEIIKLIEDFLENPLFQKQNFTCEEFDILAEAKILLFALTLQKNPRWLDDTYWEKLRKIRQQLKPSVSPRCKKIRFSSNPSNYEEVLSLVASAREPILYAHLIQDVHLVSFSPLRIELRLNHRAPKNLLRELEDFLWRTTNDKWQVVLSNAEGNPTIIEQNKVQEEKRLKRFSNEQNNEEI